MSADHPKPECVDAARRVLAVLTANTAGLNIDPILDDCTPEQLRLMVAACSGMLLGAMQDKAREFGCPVEMVLQSIGRQLAAAEAAS